MLLISGLFVWLSLAAAVVSDNPVAQKPRQGDPFKPLTYELNFKAYFRVQAFAAEQPVYKGDIYESYHSHLGTGLIRQTSHGETRESGDKGDHLLAPPVLRKFLFDNRSRRLLEFTKGPQLESEGATFHDDFYLYENGGSSAYLPDRLQEEFRKDSIRLVPEGESIDSLLLMGQRPAADLTLPELNLDQFMRPECLEVLRRARLHYISGLARLLHLIECRRDEFKLQPTVPAGSQARQQVEPLTRGQTRLVYRAKSLATTASALTATSNSSTVKQLDMLITVHKTSSPASATLAPGAVPLSFVLSLEPATTSILVNLYQFETVGADEHLSESAGGHSIYLMPLAQPNLSSLLTSLQHENDDHQRQVGGVAPSGGANLKPSARSFSFEALLTGSHLGAFYPDPIELTVSYDAQLGMLATWTTFVDRTHSDGQGGWRRQTVRQLHDSQSGLKFHLMSSNFNYASHNDGECGASANTVGAEACDTGAKDNRTEEAPPEWRACATDKLSTTEIALLQEGSDGLLLNLAGATYMGEALVRGIRCRVYERRLYELPTLLALGENDYLHLGAHWARSKVYLNLFAYGDDDNDAELEASWATRFARLDFRVVSQSDDTQQRSFTLDLSGFGWSATGVTSRALFSGEHMLARLAQECLLMVPGARHLDLELWLGLGLGSNSSQWQKSSAGQSGAELLAELANNDEQRDESVREMLAAGSLGLSPIQQVDLISEVPLLSHKHTGRTDSDEWENFDTSQLLHVKFSLYELWADSIKEEYIGYARSLTLNSRLPAEAGLLAGARAYSHAECRWRAVHSLQPDRARQSELNRRAEDEDTRNLRVFMFCPARLACLLGDASWTPMRRQQPLRLANLLEYPYKFEAAGEPPGGGGQQEDPAKCFVAAVLIRQQVASAKQSEIDTGFHRQLDWWLINGASGLGRPARSLAEQRISGLRLHLKVKGSAGGASAYATSYGDGEQATRSLEVKVNKLKVSNRVFASASASDSGCSQATAPTAESCHDVSLLIKPLAGLAYLPGGGGGGSGGGGGGATPESTRPPAAAVISPKPLVVTTLAACSRACLHSHECKSFSACHEQQEDARHVLSCVLSRLSWSSPNDFHKLVQLSEANATSAALTGAALAEESRPLLLEVSSPSSEAEDQDYEELTKIHDAGETAQQRLKVQVALKRSRLCSLHARAQMDLFRMARPHLDYVPGAKFLIRARSAEHCARLCQERAQLMRELAWAKSGANESQTQMSTSLGSSFRSAACHEFRFAAEGSYCQLLPLQDHWSTLGLGHLLLTPEERNASGASSAWQPAGEPNWRETARTQRASLPTLSRWLRWFTGSLGAQSGDWLAQLRTQLISEADHYELDFEQIFLAQRNMRLAFKAPTSSASPQDGQPQERLTQYSLYACAKRCLQLKGCRSFDVDLAWPAGKTRGNGGGGGGAPGAFQSYGQQRASVCQLNVISAADLRASPSAWPSFELERLTASRARGTTGGSEWWHYEPTELALFMMADPGEPLELGSASGA